MATISNPGTLLSAYRPIQYEIVSDNTALLYEKAVITLYDSTNTQLAQYRVDWYEKTPVLSLFKYKYRIDVSGLVRSLLYPLPDQRTATLLPPSAKNAVSQKNSIEVYVKVRFEYRDSTTNLIEDAGVEITSGNTVALALARQHAEAQSLIGYVDTVNRQLLHEIPESGLIIAPDEAFSMSFIHSETITTCRLSVTQTNGATDTAFFAFGLIGGSTATDKKVHTVGVGPRNLNAIPPSSWVDSFNIEIDETIRSYEIDFGSGNGAGYTQITESALFVIEKQTPSRLRIHWLNNRGAFDSYTFDAVLRRGIDADATAAKRSLTWSSTINPHNSEQQQNFKTSVQSADFYEVESRILIDALAGYVAGLINSVEVYAETPNVTTYTPVVVQGGKVIHADNELVGLIIKAQVYNSAENINLEQ